MRYIVCMKKSFNRILRKFQRSKTLSKYIVYNCVVFFAVSTNKVGYLPYTLLASPQICLLVYSRTAFFWKHLKCYTCRIFVTFNTNAFSIVYTR